MPSNKNASSYIADKKYAFVTIKAAEAAAMELGCTGYHVSMSGLNYPCKNRAMLLKALNIPGSEQLVLKASTPETIDYAVLKWVEEVVNVHAETNQGFKKVPVVWLTAERAFLVKQSRELRQSDSDALIFPLISIKRDNMEKIQAGSRPIPGNIFKQRINGLDFPINQFYIGKKIQQDKTRNFAREASLRLHGPDENFPTPLNQRIEIGRAHV